jgi:hypothetical protein
LWIPGQVFKEKTAFYHGVIDSEEATARLLHAEEASGSHVVGRFLFREAAMAAALKEIPDDHVLSVVVGPGEVSHMRVSKPDGSDAYTVDDAAAGGCTTLQRLMEWLKGHGSPPLTIGCLGMKVSTSDDVRALVAQRSKAKAELGDYREARTQSPTPIVGGATGLVQAQNDVHGFHRGGGGTRTPMFLPGGQTAGEGFTLDAFAHGAISSLEADGLLLDTELTGSVTVGKFVLRSASKAEQKQLPHALYALHVVHQETAESGNYFGCLRTYHIVAPFGEQGGAYEVVAAEEAMQLASRGSDKVAACTSIEQLFTDVLFSQQPWWTRPLTKAVPPYADRRSAKAVEVGAILLPSHLLSRPL